MIKNLSRAKVFLIGCGVPLIFLVIFKLSQTLGLDWSPAFEVIATGLLFLSFPWSTPSFVFSRELGGSLDSSLAGYIETVSTVIGFGINFLLLVKFGVRCWLIAALIFAILITVSGLIFSIWMIAS